MIVGWLVGAQLRSRFARYSKEKLGANLSGKQIADKMLEDHNITDVQVMSVQGQLTDHYDPGKKTVNLSHDVYSGHNAAAAAVAAHECGHAVQHAAAYSFLQVRSALVPVVSFTSNIVQWVLLAGIVMIDTFPQLLFIGIILFASITVFSLITLPVEFDASRRALLWMEKSGVTTPSEHSKAKDALWWAAMTYVVAALASIATLLYYIMLFAGRRRSD